MSRVMLRRDRFRADEAHVGVHGDKVLVHLPGIAWEGTHTEFLSEFHDWSETLWSRYCTAVSHAAVLEMMLPRGAK